MKKLAFLLVIVLILAVPDAGRAEDIVIDDRRIEQEQIDSSIKAEIDTGEYTLDDPFVLLDPYALSPLTAIVGFVTESPTRVSVEVPGVDEATTITHDFTEFGTKHVLPIYGLYAGVENEVSITAYPESGDSMRATVKIQTDPLPDDIAVAEVKIGHAEKMASGLTFFSMAGVGSNYPLAIDSNGAIRWYLSNKNLGASINLLCLENGNFIAGSGKLLSDSSISQTSIYELTPLGKLVMEYEVYGVHHDIKEKPDGNLLVGACKEGRDTINDYIVELDRATGEIVDEYDLMEILPMTEFSPQPQYTSPNNWFHNNGIWYDEEEDALILSGRTQDMIVKISCKDKSVVWALAKNSAKDNERLAPYILHPETDDFEYPTAQHACMILPDGRLFLFDNANFVDPPEEGEALDQTLLYSRAVIYTIDEANKTIREDWSFGKERLDLYSSYVSDVDYLGENHYLIDFGGIFTSEDGNALDFSLTPSDELHSDTVTASTVVVEIVDDVIVYEVELTGGISPHTYKAERHNIYHNALELFSE